jgi:hypothetical protein
MIYAMALWTLYARLAKRLFVAALPPSNEAV